MCVHECDYVIVDMWKFVHVWYVSFHACVDIHAYSCSCEWSWRRTVCYISHVFVYVISLYRRVFDFTVSNVSNVSILYFSRDFPWHVWRHRNVSCVQNQVMYTLWWMMCEIGAVRNEHGKCSFYMGCTINHGYAVHDVCVWICSPLIVSMFIVAAYVRCMSFACYIYHGFMNMFSLYRRVFKITVSSVSDVSIVVAVGLSADTLVDTVTC